MIATATIYFTNPAIVRGLALGILLGLAGNSGAAIGVADPPSPAPAATGTTTAISATATVSSGANVLVVLLATRAGSTAYSDPATLSWSGQTLVQIATASDNLSTFRNVSLYCLLNPTNGTANVTGTGAAGTTFWALKSFTLSGVDTVIAPLTNGVGGGNGTTNLSVSITGCPVGGLAAACANWSTITNAINLSASSGAATATSEYFSAASGNDIGMGYISGISAGSNTFSATVTNGNKCAFVVAVFTPANSVVPVLTNTPPVITNASFTVSSLALSGTNGMPNAYYQVQAATNLTTPGSAWTSLATYSFDATGNFSNATPLSAGPAQFYRLRVPGGGTPPIILSSPQSLTVIAGQNATFAVSTTGTAPLGYQWLVGGDPLPGASGLVLNITNAQSDDEGIYSTLVTNSIGLARSSGALLTVIAPPVITSPAQDQSLSVGQDATFAVVASGSPLLSYQWYFNTNTLLPGATGDTLLITNLQTSNAGRYSVVVTNLGGRATNIATLMVNPLPTPPVVVTPPQDKTVTVGQSATFSVAVSGTPPLRYQWFFNTNTPLASATNASLTITSAQTNNAGWYSVSVTNNVGATSASARLGVITNSSATGLIGWATVADRGLTNTTGGAGGTTVTVSNITDLNTHAMSSSRRIIYVSGTMGGNFSISSNKTIIGLPGATLTNCSIDITRGPNIILRNLKVVGKNCSDDPTCNGAGSDAIHLEGTNVHHVWLDHLDISDGSDGNLDMTKSVDYVTVSWCKFWYSTPGRGHQLSNLISGADTSTSDRGHLKITYAYCWWSTNVNSRMPRGRFGQIHMINCYWNAPGNDYCINSGVEMQVRIENGYFENVNDPFFLGATNGAIAASGNLFVNCTGNQDVGGTVFVPHYPYTLEPAANVPAIVQAGAGPK